MRGAGIVITTVKGMHYEWVRDLATSWKAQGGDWNGTDRPD
jgi:hypothetical protein